MKYTNLENLKELIKDHLHVEAYDLDSLSFYCRNTKFPSGIEIVERFKQELYYALTHEGAVTPGLYERWTGEDLDDQVEVQKRLQEIWDACFSNPKTP